MALGSGRRIVVEFIGDASALRKATGEGGAALQGFSGKAQAAGRIAGRALAGGLLLAGAAAVSATKAAAEDEAAQAQLAQQLKQAAGATDAQVASTEAWITAQGVATGMADDELRPALANLATATGDVEEAQRLATLALDVAAGSGKTYEQVTTAMVKAQNGSVGGLGRLGVATKNAAGETMTFAEIQKNLATKYMGAAADAAETTAGKQKILSTQFGELQEQIGAKLLPVMVKLSTVGLKVVDWISKNTTLVGTFVASLGGLLAVTWAVGTATKAAAAAQSVWAAATAVSAAVSKLMNSTFVLRLQLMALDAAAWVTSTAAMVANKVAMAAATVASVAMSAATKAMAAGQWLLNAAMTANPIGLVVLAIAALVAGLILAYKKSETFRNIVNAAFGAVAKAVGVVVEFIKRHWQTMLAILTGPIGIAVLLITKNWDKIKAGATAVKDWIADKFTAAKDAIVDKVNAARIRVDAVWEAIKTGFVNVKERLSEVAGNIKDSIVGAFQSIMDKVQAVIDKIQWLIDKIKSIPKPDLGDLNPFGRVGAPSGVGGTVVGRGSSGGEVSAIVQFVMPGGKVIEQQLIRWSRETGRPIQVRTI